MPYSWRYMSKKVLIIEDDHNQCEALGKLLARRNLEISCAESFAEGLACFHAQDFACVILDPGLPDSDASQSVSRLPEFDGTPVVVLTGNDDRDLIRECRKHGAGYALKSADTPLLMEKVLMAIERHSPSREIEDHIIDEQRHSLRSEKLNKVPWFLQWVPLMSLTVMIALALMGGGASLYRSISNQASEASQNASRYTAVERSITQIQTSFERLSTTQAELIMKAQTSTDDRAGLHREITAVVQQQTELKNDVVRRLERIEDGQQALLKEFVKRP